MRRHEINQQNDRLRGPCYILEDAFISSLALLTSSAICCHFCELPLPFNQLLCSLQRLSKISSSAVPQVFLFLLVVLAVDRSFQNSLPANEVNSIRLPAQTMFQVSKFLAKLTDLGTVMRIWKDTSNPAEQYKLEL